MTRPRYRIVGGMRMPLGFPAGGLESGMHYRPAAGDIFVASYPKSGTTWLQYIVYLLIRRRPLGPDETLTEAFPHLEEVGAETVARLPEPRLIKTHLDFERTPYAASARYLVIARNPFDCAVSFYHHTRGFPQHYDFAGGTFADFFECFVRGEVDFGGYFDHLISWHAAAARDNVYFLTYEALRADTRRQVREIAAFLGDSAVAAVAGDADLGALLAETGIESMQRDQQRWSSRRPEWAEAFVRKGAVGGWQQQFSSAMARELLAEFDRRLAGTDLEGLWPDILGDARAFAGEAKQD